MTSGQPSPPVPRDAGGQPGGGHSAGWVAEALREHDEQAGREAARPERQGSPQPRPGTVREDLVLDRIDRARRARPRVKEERITMSHGAGGKATQTLIEAIFLDGFRNPLLEPLEDAARVHVNGARVALTTDSYVVSPLFFPGGDIGDLAVNGTVNDLAVSGAVPLYLSAGFILEEGFPVADLSRIVASMQAAAQRAGVQIVTGDTKVVNRGAADRLFINTAGIGVVAAGVNIAATRALPKCWTKFTTSSSTWKPPKTSSIFLCYTPTPRPAWRTGNWMTVRRIFSRCLKPSYPRFRSQKAIPTACCKRRS